MATRLLFIKNAQLGAVSTVGVPVAFRGHTACEEVFSELSTELSTLVEKEVKARTASLSDSAGLGTRIHPKRTHEVWKGRRRMQRTVESATTDSGAQHHVNGAGRLLPLEIAKA